MNRPYFQKLPQQVGPNFQMPQMPQQPMPQYQGGMQNPGSFSGFSPYQMPQGGMGQRQYGNDMLMPPQMPMPQGPSTQPVGRPRMIQDGPKRAKPSIAPGLMAPPPNARRK